MGESETRAGTVALVGLPNAGKSSLLNRLLDSKLSIVTPLAQTTRERVVGIDTRDGVQMIFIDTPGIVEPSYLLHRSMAHVVGEAIADADVVVFVLDGTRSPPAIPEETLARLRSVGDRLLPVVNKIDVAADTRRGESREWAAATLGRPAIELSAESGEGIETLREIIGARLPLSPFLYPDDELSSQSVRFFVSELIRETIFEQFGQEVPYSTAVRIEEFREAESPILIRASVLVERPSQKAILIGKGGSAIRELGTASRAKIEEFVGAPVYLDLWIKVLPRWRKDPVELRRLGFTLPEDQH
jgi:GTP-binding protein Era